MRGKANLTDEMRAAVICREFGWTWNEYWEQPQVFIDVIIDMLNEEAKAQERRNSKKTPNNR